VYLDYRQENERSVEFLDYRDTVKYLEEGQFGEGSMAPKIKACLQFIRQGGRKSVITEATLLENKKYGTKITLEYED
jgi:carbamate kinase